MNFTKVILLVLSLHIVVVGLLFQQGTTSQLQEAPKPEQGTERPRVAPTRPSEDDSKESFVESTTAQKQLEDVRIYKVKKGDSLWTVAKKEHISIKDLLEANNLSQNTPLQVGMELKIKAKESKPTSSSEDTYVSGETTTYVVKKGDSLSKIALVTKTPLATLKKINQIRNNTIYEGQKLIIAGKNVNLAALNSTPTAKEVKKPAPVLTGETYSIAKGDTLSIIAKKHGMTVVHLKELNHLNDSSILKIGQVLNVKGEKKATSTPTPAAAESTSTGIATQPSSATTPSDSSTINGSKHSIEDESIFENTDEIPVVPVNSSTESSVSTEPKGTSESKDLQQTTTTVTSPSNQ